MREEVISVSTIVARFIYDNEDILLELDGSNNITARYTHGPGIDEPLIMEKAGASFFYHADGLGSITEITDASGVVKQRYTYSSFGKIESQLDPTFIQPYTFTSREFDPETDLYFNRHRTYDWRTGRFNQVDPVGLMGGDINLYSYIRNNPVGFGDPDDLIAPAVPAIAACLVDPPCAAAVGALTLATGYAIKNAIVTAKKDLDRLLDEAKKRLERTVETTAQPEQPGKFCPPPSDPGNTFRACLGACLSDFNRTQSYLRFATCLALCVVGSLGG